MEKERKKHLSIILGLAGVFILLIFMMEWLASMLRFSCFQGAGLLRTATHIVKIIGEGGVVACTIGVIIEISHFRRFYESIIRRFLTDEGYLRKFKASTLDSIVNRCYKVRNENEITNALHKWEDQFRFAWQNLKDLPTKAYFSKYTHKIEYKFCSQEQLPEPNEFSEKFELKKLNQEIIIIKDTIEYDLVSPYLDKPYLYTISTVDVLRPFKNNPNSIDNEKCLVYELEINGNPVQLTKGPDYSVEQEKEGLKFELHYEIEALAATHILVRAYSVEPQVDNYYCYFSGGLVLDRQEVYFRSNVKLRKLDYNCWFPNMDDSKLREVEKSQLSLTFIYDKWVFPGAGFVIVWER